MTFRSLILLAAFLAVVSCQRKNEQVRNTGASGPIPIADLVKPPPGPFLPNTNDPATTAVQVHCSRCHALPDPTQLTRQLWVNIVLPEMGCYLGMHHQIPQYAPFIEKRSTPAEAKLYKQRGLYPDQPVISRNDWDLIVTWFLKNSPDELPPSNNVAHPPLPPGKFDISFIGPANPVPQTTLIHIDPVRHRFISSDAASKSLTIHDPSGKVLDTKLGPGPFTTARTPANSPFQQFVAVGTLYPNDALTGSIWTNPSGDSLDGLEKTSIPPLKRPIGAVWFDLDHDGNEEVVVAEYGNKTGQLSLFKMDTEGSWKRIILNHVSGNIRIKVVDMNHDGWEDLVVLRAQESEELLIYYNTGKLKFLESHVLRFPPYWGSNDFELADLNDDGHLDLLLANGDNDDSTRVLKNFHGVYLYLNDGKGGFRFNQSFPLHGAYGVRTLDYDLDGDLDLVTFSAFPDFETDQTPVYLIEQTKPLSFKTYSLPQSKQSWWIVMDIGDLDGDGDTDILFGPNHPSSSLVPAFLAERARTLPGSFLLMKNLAAP